MRRPYRSRPHGPPPYRLKIFLPNGPWLVRPPRFTLCATRPPGCFVRASLLATFVTMATRVRNQPARQPGAPAARTGAGGRGTSASYSGGTPRKRSTKKKPPPKRGPKTRAGQTRAGQTRRRPGPRPPARPHAPVVILIGGSGRAAPAPGVGGAGALGFPVGSGGRRARDIEPHHRRDGIGLLPLG